MAKRQRWKIGDVFIVRMKDGRLAVGQIVGREAKALNSITVAFFEPRFDREEEVALIEPIDMSQVFSIVFATRDSIDSGSWKVVGHWPVAVPPERQPYAHLKVKRSWVGAKIIGSGIINEFLDAYYGLVPWDDWHDPAYLDGLLISPDKKPVERLIFKRGHVQ